MSETMHTLESSHMASPSSGAAMRTIVIGLTALGGAYVWGARHLGARARRAGTEPPVVRRGQQGAFFSGLLVIFLSLNGPLHDLSDTYLFSAHMVQHLVLALAVPPLLLVGTPGWMLACEPVVGLPDSATAQAGPLVAMLKVVVAQSTGAPSELPPGPRQDVQTLVEIQDGWIYLVARREALD